MRMRLSWRDGVETLLAALVVVVVVGVVQEKEWSLIGTARAATGTLFVIGFVMCQMGRGGITSAGDLVRGPFMTTASVLGGVALALTIIGIAAPRQTVVVTLGGLLIFTWLLATVHHAWEARPTPIVR
jgi:hypothetical protein